MKISFFLDVKLIQKGKELYTTGAASNEYFETHKINKDDELIIICRQEANNIQNLSKELSLASGNNMEFITIKKYSEIFKRKNYKEIKEIIKQSDLSYIKMPTIIGIVACNLAKRNSKEYIVEMVGCAWDSLWNHGSLKAKLFAPILYFINKNKIREASNVIYVSNEFLQKRYPTKGKHIGCSDVKIESITEETLEKRLKKIKSKQDRKYKIGLIGSLNTNYKGHEVAIKALARLKDRGDSYEMHFLGVGEPKKWIKLSKKYGVKNKVFFDGVLPHDKVFKWLDDIDIFIMPSLTEGMPRALIEAMSRGCPCIGSNVGGISELLPIDKTIRKKDYKDLSEKILYLINNKEEMEKCAITNFEKSKDFNKEIIIKKRKKFIERNFYIGKGDVMIKVLHIFNAMDCGGAETMIMNVYRKIDKRNIQFEFLCMSNKKGDYDDEIKRLGGRIYKISSPSKVGYIKHIKEILKICREKGPYKVIHIPTQFHSGVVCLAAYIAKIPIRIVHSHSAGDIKVGIIRKIYQYLSRILINIFSTDEIACGEKARDYLFGKSKKVEKNVIILKNGIDIRKYEAVSKKEIINFRKELGIEQNEFIIGHVGRFEKVKNHDFLLELAEQFKNLDYKVRFLLVGEGSLKKEFEKKIKSKNLNEYFIIAGKRKDIPIVMNAIDIFIMPSLYEGFPMVIIEALAAGKKCIVSCNVSKEVEIIKDSVKFIDLEEQIEQWRKVIIDTANEKVIKEDYDKELIDKGFDVERTTRTLEKLYLR